MGLHRDPKQKTLIGHYCKNLTMLCSMPWMTETGEYSFSQGLKCLLTYWEFYSLYVLIVLTFIVAFQGPITQTLFSEMHSWCKFWVVCARWLFHAHCCSHRAPLLVPHMLSNLLFNIFSNVEAPESVTDECDEAVKSWTSCWLFKMCTQYYPRDKYYC